MVLDDAEIIRAMEPEMNGQYTPIKIKASGLDANGDPKEDLFEGDHANPKYFYESSYESLLQEGQLHQVFHHLERMLEQMVHELYHGSMEAKPLSGKVNGCDYCEFSSVCGYREGDPVRDYQTMKKADFSKHCKRRMLMAEFRLTIPQRQAVTAPIGNLLVAAAAGSGKTAVLSQRVLRHLTEEPILPANRLLIVTFTVLASVEMRTRIEQRLAEKLEEDPQNEMLQRQQFLLSQAQISTIHSFARPSSAISFKSSICRGIPESGKRRKSNRWKKRCSPA